MNKTVLIFGGSSGIGLETAIKLREKDYTVYNASRTACPEPDVTDILTDVTQKGAAASAVRQAAGENGALDAVIYSAGYSMAAPIEYVREEDYRYLFDVNFFGALAVMQAAIPFMREAGGGRIILISSIGGAMPIPFDAFYSCSKAAIDMLAREANIELAPYNIRVSSVQPGGTATRFTFKRNVYPESDCGTYGEELNKAAVALAKIEQGGMAPSEVAGTVVKVLEDGNPPVITASGFTNKAVSLAGKLLPLKISEALNKNQYLQ